MKKVNFISSLSPHKQYAIARWFWLSAALCVASIIIVGYFVLPQLVAYRKLRNDVFVLRQKTDSHTQSLKNKDALKTEHELVRTRGAKVDHYNNQPKNAHQFIAAIMDASGNSITIELMRFNKKDCELTALCPTPEHATVFIKRLSASDKFADIKLVSLQHDAQAQQFRSIIKGKVVFL